METQKPKQKQTEDKENTIRKIKEKLKKELERKKIRQENLDTAKKYDFSNSLKKLILYLLKYSGF